MNIKTNEFVGRNNLSRQLFKEYCKSNGVMRDGARNVFSDNGKKWCWVLENETHTVRQFYDDCVGVVVDGVGSFTREELRVNDTTRKTPSGIPARNAHYSPRLP